ncbi:MAG: hypothetical protein ACI39H_06330 [Lachnospiraceae bacterium]
MDYSPKEPLSQTSPESALSVSGLTLSIIGLFFSFVPMFGSICPSIAVTLALLSRGKGYHTAGKSRIALILGLLGIIICIVVTVLVFAYVVSNVDSSTLLDIMNSSTDTYL